MSKSEQLVRLVTDPGPGVHVRVLDHAFAERAGGLDRVDVKLPPGLYQLQFLEGRSIREQLVALEPGMDTQVIEPPEIHFNATAPIRATKSGDSGQERAAARLSHKQHAVLGDGAQLFVFVRDLDRLGRGALTQDLTLHRIDGEQILDIDAVADADRSSSKAGAPWAGATVALEPGPYRLRVVASGVGRVEQLVWVQRGWQTQVFLVRTRAKHSRVPQLSAASVLMARLGRGFNPGLRELRLAEVARQGLADTRPALSGHDLDTLLRGKFENPMLGLLGVHNLLLADPVDEARVRRVMTRMRHLLPGHPDLRAVDVWLGRKATAFEYPPMLRSSWAILIEGSARGRAAVPPGSLSSEVADRLFGTGAWLVWRTPRRHRRDDPHATPRRAGEPFHTVLQRLAAALPDDATEQVDGLTALEQDVVALSKQRAPTESQTVAVKALGVPLQVADEAVAGVAEKFDVRL
jgi:hypothetical protein